MCDRFSAGLLDLGLDRGDRIALMTDRGSPYWHFLDFGMQQIGVVVVPVHANISRRELAFILRDAAVKYCIVTNRELSRKVAEVRADLPELRDVYTFEKLPDRPSIEKLAVVPTDKHLEKIQTLRAVIHEDDLATIIYTSGATGEPKGVLLSHKNIVSNIKSVIALIPVNCDKRAFSFLPLSHIFERMVTYTYQAVGASLYYGAPGDALLTELREARPHYFTVVPRVLERFYEGILERAAGRPLWVRRLIMWAIHIGERYDERRQVSPFYWLQRRIADLLVYQFWRRALGGKVEGVVVGAAALQPRLGRIFSAAGIDVREGYGLTETAPVVAFNRFEPGGVRFGTVGIPIPGVEVRIDAPNDGEEGEILVKGPNVMLGYNRRPASEMETVITPDGWLRTGDVGRFVHKRFLQITDRKKDIFKTSNGKYIAPQRVETHFKHSPYIEQCMVLGANRPHLSALILPCFPILERWCADQGVHWTAPQFMIINPRVERKMAEEIEKCNQQLEAHQRVRRYTLLHQPWSEETGELTPTLKNRRHRIEKQYEKEIAEMYAS